MRLSIRLLGLDFLTIEASTDEPQDSAERGESTSYPIGFTVSPGEAWEQGVDR